LDPEPSFEVHGTFSYCVQFFKAPLENYLPLLFICFEIESEFTQ